MEFLVTHPLKSRFLKKYFEAYRQASGSSAGVNGQTSKKHRSTTALALCFRTYQYRAGIPTKGI